MKVALHLLPLQVLRVCPAKVLTVLLAKVRLVRQAIVLQVQSLVRPAVLLIPVQAVLKAFIIALKDLI